MKGVRKSLRSGGGSGSDDWETIKTKFAPAVVQIVAEYPRSFLLNKKGSGQGTGFVVDKKRGIILTNKHILTSGPVRAKAKFLRNEEIDLVPIYRDPVHDFGFFTFDVSKLDATPSVQIELNPEGATAQTKVLIMGNNAGEKLTFIETAIGRTDRNAFEALDCNTFFISASDISTFGSSGSPVLNLSGEAVALKTWGNASTNSSWYLPLHRVQRALKLIQAGKKVKRGTLQLAFLYTAYPDVQRLNVPANIVENHRKAFPSSDGMLVVNKTLPKGPGSLGGFHNGDVLVSVQGNLVEGFVDLAEAMDENCGKELKWDIVRAGQAISLRATVQDFEDISPNQYVEISGGLVCGMDYLIALQYNRPMEGVIVSESGYMFRQAKMREFDVISRIGQDDVVDLATFKKVFQRAENGSALSIKFTDIQDSVYTFVEQLHVDKTWFPFTYARRNDKTGKWDTEDLLPSTPPETFIESAIQSTQLSSREQDQKNAIVVVSFHTPLRTGDVGNPPTYADALVSHRSSEGVGVIVNAALGLVVCAKSIVGSSLGDISVTFNSAFETRATVLFSSPTLPFAIVRYDPSQVASDAVAKVAEIRISEDSVIPGEKLSFIGIAADYSKEIGEGRVKRVEFNGNTPPYNFQVAVMAGQNGAGAYVDEKSKAAKVIALSGSTSLLAMSMLPFLERIVRALEQKQPVPQQYAALGIHLSMITLAKARAVLGLTDAWASKLADASPHGHNTLLSVSRRMVGSDAYVKFANNDVILAINGKPTCDFAQFAKQAEQAMDVTVLREEKVVELQKVETTSFATVGADRVLSFAGMVLHAPHAEIYYNTEPEKIDDGGVYVAELKQGSPSLTSENADEQPGQKRGKLIYEVNNVRINSLDEFMQAISKVGDSQYCSITTNNYNTGESKMFNIRLDLEYWPTILYKRSPHNQWTLTRIQHNPK